MTSILQGNAVLLRCSLLALLYTLCVGAAVGYASYWVYSSANDVMTYPEVPGGLEHDSLARFWVGYNCFAYASLPVAVILQLGL